MKKIKDDKQNIRHWNGKNCTVQNAANCASFQE